MGRPDRIGAFDGMRGLAVCAVVLFHAQISGASGGFLGVSAFFTLSGFLITSLLLDEHARSGRIALGSFWARRARRLLPAAFLTIAAVLLYGATVASVDQIRSLRADALAALADVANWRFYFSGRSYEHLFSTPSPVLHFWSLAIEEQFYLVFPLLVAAALWIGRGRRIAVGALAVAGVTASVAAGWLLDGSAGQSRVYYGTDTRAAELLVGALLAIVLAQWPVPTKPRTRARVFATLAGGAALFTMLWWWATVDQSDGWLYHGGFALHAVLTAIVIAAVRVDGPLSRALSWRPLAALGLLSYGIYLFHWPIFLWLSPERTGLATLPLLGVRVGLTLALAVGSYYLLERPVLRGERLRGHWPRVAAAGTVAALVATLLVVTSSLPAPEVVLSALGDTKADVRIASVALAAPPRPVTPEPSTPTTARPAAPRPVRRGFTRRTPTGRPLRVMVVGDSVGLTLGRGVELWARQEGDARVDNIARIYCPLGRDLPARQGYAETTPRACDWTDAWRSAVQSFDPDVTIVLFTIWEAAPRQLPATNQWEHPGQPAFDAWQLSEYQAAADTLTARGGHVVWMTVPCDSTAAIDKSHGLWYVNERTIPALAASRPLVQVLDLDANVCPGDKFTSDVDGVRNARPDGAHFSDIGALATANWAMPIILGAAPVPPYRREAGPLPPVRAGAR